MKSTPRSVWLSMANRMAAQAAGCWGGVLANAAKRNPSALLKALATPPKPKAPSRRKRR